MKLSKYSILIGITILAFFLRTWQIGTNPVSLNWDEVAFGYNAYTLGVDGRDEFGVFLPYKYLESFGDFKPPLYAYLAIIPIKLFGLTEFAVRFPSALFGTGTIIITYFLVRRMFSPRKNAVHLALLSAAVLAISPWHINLSRGAYEANVSTFFIVTGIWLFLEAVLQRKWLLLLSAISFALSFYTFNTARIVVPILVPLLAVAYIKPLLKAWQTTLIAGGVGFCLILPLVGFLISPQAALRYKEVNIFTDISVIERTNQQVTNDNNAIWSKVLHNRRLAYSVEYVKHYLDNFSPSFLFIDGDENYRFGTRDLGILYLYEAPFLFLGLILLFRKREGVWWLIPLWIIVGLIPAATARETPHALRTLTILPTYQILIAYGLFFSYNWFRERHVSQGIKQVVLLGFGLVVALSLFYYLYGYYVFYPYESARPWSDGYKESIAYVTHAARDYDQINVTNTMGRPYIYYLFYAKTPPNVFRASADISHDPFGFVSVNGFSKYRFSSNPLAIPTPSKRVLYIDTPEKVPPKAKVKQIFYLPDGSQQLVAFTV